MKNIKPTEGEWIAHRCGDALPNRHVIISHLGKNQDDIQEIRSIAQIFDYCGVEEAAENAKLIAKSKKMYEAILKVISYNEDIRDGKINYRPKDHIQVLTNALV